MATSILLRSARSVRDGIRSEHFSRCDIQRFGIVARLFSSKLPDNDVVGGASNSCVSVMEGESDKADVTPLKNLNTCFTRLFYGNRHIFGPLHPGIVVISVDLGTTNSCVSIIQGKNSRVIENSEGALTTPSVVGFTPDGQMLIGDTAKRLAMTYPANSICAVKRLIGRRYDDPHILEVMKKVPYKIVKAPNGDAWVEVNGQKHSPSQIGAFLLSHMKETAEAYLGRYVCKAVITVPADFNDSQRKVTKEAGRIAGLRVQRIVNEPTAAALSFASNNQDRIFAGSKRVVAVYHLGGGTFDVSIISLYDNVLKVKATNGDTFLGGEDFDNTLLEYLVSEFKRTESVDLSEDKLALQRLREAAEKAKIELSSTSQTEINLPFITADASGAKHLNITMTRSKLESLVNHLIEKTRNLCQRCLKDAKVSVKDIDEVLLVGGMTRVPKVQEVVFEIFGKSPSEGVNPDEAVLVGASILGSMEGPKVFDVTSRWIGILTLGGSETLLIDKKTVLPAIRKQFLSTTVDNQKVVNICVLEGRSYSHFKRCLLEYEGIPPAPRAMPVIEIITAVDAGGCFEISLNCTLFGKRRRIHKKPKDAVDTFISNSKNLVAETDLQVIKKLDERKVSVPVPVNWVTQNAVTEVINQGRCGSCWAQALVAALETLYFIHVGVLIRLSAQHLVDCAVKDGCKGAPTYWPYRFVKIHGISAYEDYPYTGKSQSCRISVPIVMRIDGYRTVGLSLHEVKVALGRQPLVAAYTITFCRNDAYKLHRRMKGKGDIFYYNGRVDAPERNSGHAVCIVGWLPHPTKDMTVLIIKESQGKGWGTDGYCYLAVRDDWELRQIFLLISYPVWPSQPLSIGIETLGGIFTRMINKNSAFPVKKSQVFSTATDNQSQVAVRVLLGERAMAADNVLLGEFELLGIPPAPRGLPQIEVTFEIGANGNVTVSAKDVHSGKEQQIAVKSSGGLLDMEIQLIAKDAERHALEDKVRKSLADMRNSADTSIYIMEKSLSEYKDKIPAEVVQEIQDAVSDLRKASAGDDVDEIKAKLDIADKAICKIGQPMSGGSSGDQRFLFLPSFLGDGRIE